MIIYIDKLIEDAEEALLRIDKNRLDDQLAELMKTVDNEY